MNTNASRQSPASAVHDRIAAIVGGEYCTADPGERQFYSTDLSFLPGEIAALVVRPGSTDELAAAVTVAAEAGMAVVARGASGL
mgnify:CR=1 FL=1